MIWAVLAPTYIVTAPVDAAGWPDRYIKRQMRELVGQVGSPTADHVTQAKLASASKQAERLGFARKMICGEAGWI